MAKIRIFQPIVPEYRVALFEGLAKRYGDDIEVVASERIGRDVSVPLTKMRYNYAHPFRKIGPELWQRGVNLCGLVKGDVVVVCGDIHIMSSLWLAWRARQRGIGVVWWGHHVSAQARSYRVAIRLWLAKHLSDVFLCYTDVGIDYLKSHGIPRVFATGNTIDLDSVESAVREWSPSKIEGFKRANGLAGKRVILFCGVLREKVRLDVLLRALKKVRGKEDALHLVVIGDGEKSDEWRQLSVSLGVASAVTWVGEVRGQDRLAPWFLSSEVFVYPGRVGLSLIHAFSFCLPVLLNDNKNNHGPEYTVFRPGVNGISFREGDVDDLSDKIVMAMSDRSLSEKGRVGRDLVFRDYSMRRMVERYSEALEAAKNIWSQRK